MKYLRILSMVLITALLGTALLAAPEENPKATKAAPKAPPKKPASTTPPDMTNVVYGSDKKFNVLDLWKAKSDKPTPLIIFIHGGGASRAATRTRSALSFRWINFSRPAFPAPPSITGRR